MLEPPLCSEKEGMMRLREQRLRGYKSVEQRFWLAVSFGYCSH